MSIELHNKFNIIGCSRFLPLHIVRYISVLKFREKLVAVAVVLFQLMALFKFEGILNSGVMIELDLATGLISLVDSASNFNCLSLAITFLCKMSIFLFLLL